MIRTASTLNISSHDMQNFSYIINGTQLGLLSSASQSIHIQSSHRPFQYLVGIEAEKDDLVSGLTRQRQLLSRYLTVTNILSQRGPGELNNLLGQYELLPDFLLCYDENRLQAWLPRSLGFYLFRNGELRRVKAAALQDDYFKEDYRENHSYYSLQIQADDHYLLLPPRLVTYFPAGEIAEKLLDIRQLPAKMSEIIRIAKNKGYDDDASWLAVEVQLKETDEYPDQPRQKRSGSWLGTKKTGEATEDMESGSEALHEEEKDEKEQAAGWLALLWQDKRKMGLALAGLLALLVLLLTGLVWLAGKNKTEPAAAETTQTQAETTLTTAKPSPTKRPTSTPVPTKPAVILVVAANRLNLRDIPDRSGKLLSVLQNGDRLIQQEEPDDGWVKIKTESGLTGYVFYDYVADEAASQR